jgi:hypothetical protein
LKLFSDKETLSPLAKQRAGDYIAFSTTKGVLYAEGESCKKFKGMHGGLLPDEMFVPFIVIP